MAVSSIAAQWFTVFNMVIGNKLPEAIYLGNTCGIDVYWCPQWTCHHHLGFFTMYMYVCIYIIFSNPLYTYFYIIIWYYMILYDIIWYWYLMVSQHNWVPVAERSRAADPQQRRPGGEGRGRRKRRRSWRFDGVCAAGGLGSGCAAGKPGTTGPNKIKTGGFEWNFNGSLVISLGFNDVLMGFNGISWDEPMEWWDSYIL